MYAWTEQRLLTTLFALLTQTKIPVAVCLFIDGLDEFDGRYIALVEMIHSLANQAHVKICLSSRPLPDFHKAFDGRPSLRLQDLTSRSIGAHAKDQLLLSIEKQSYYSNGDKEMAKHLMSNLVWRAEGVFLWAVIAIRNLRDGLHDIVDMRELQREIESLPTGVESLYMQMLTRIKPAYKRDAARFLQIFLYDSEDSVMSLDLFRLYFIDVQRVGEDLPLVCHKIDDSNLVKACQNLGTKLLSHTVGFLDLTPTKRIDDIYCRRDCYDPILFTRVHIFHRTVKDFLLNNTAAQSFVKAATPAEEHLRLSIARGTLSHLAHLSREDGGTVTWLLGGLPQVRSLRSAMQQISAVERLVRVAQSKLMRSLHAFSFIPKGLVLDLRWRGRAPHLTFLIPGPLEASIDLIGMAANCGMVRYVCEILDLPTVGPQSHPQRLSDCQHTYSTDHASVAKLAWANSSQYNLEYSAYRQQLSQYLEWEAHVDQTAVQVNSTALVETYLLACFKESIYAMHEGHVALIGVLIHAGANPMVQPELAEGPSNGECIVPPSLCFWEQWLTFLHWYAITDFRRTTLVKHSDSVLPRLKLDDLFNITKALLFQGADINYHIGAESTSDSRSLLRRHELMSRNETLDFESNFSAMSSLDECFNGYSEFRDFVADMELQIKKPWRKIVSIFPRLSRTRVEDKAYPDEEESEMLWSLIEEWEKSGDDSDWAAVRSAMRRFYKAHRPDIELSETSDSENSDSEDSALLP